MSQISEAQPWLDWGSSQQLEAVIALSVSSVSSSLSPPFEIYPDGAEEEEKEEDKNAEGNSIVPLPMNPAVNTKKRLRSDSDPDDIPTSPPMKRPRDDEDTAKQQPDLPDLTAEQ